MEKAVGILGLGCYVPEKVLTNHDLEKIVETSDEWIVERTGIKNRHIAAEGEATSDMSVIAAERALADAGVSPEEIELVIVATASADHAFPLPLVWYRTVSALKTQPHSICPQAAPALFTVWA